MPPQTPNVFQSAEVIKRLLYTLGCVSAYIVGRNIPVPGLDPASVVGAWATPFVKIGELSVFSLGIAPYVGAAVLASLFPAVVARAASGKEGLAAVQRGVRMLAAVFAVVMSLWSTLGFMSVPLGDMTVATLTTSGLMFLPIAVTLAAGAMLVVWLAEEISEHGIGSGVLLLLFVDLAAAMPSAVSSVNSLVQEEEISFMIGLLLLLIVLLCILATVFIETAQRKTMVQYAKRVVGRMMMGGQSTAVPVKANPAGVLAVVGAMTLVGWVTAIPAAGTPVVAYPLLAVSIVFFSWLYRRTNVDPVALSHQIQSMGGFIPGIRGGDPLIAHFRGMLDHLSLGSAFPLAAIAVIPPLLTLALGLPVTIAGTALILVAGISLDFVGQVQARYMMQNFGGNVPKSGQMAKGGRGSRPSKKRKKKRR